MCMSRKGLKTYHASFALLELIASNEKVLLLINRVYVCCWRKVESLQSAKVLIVSFLSFCWSVLQNVFLLSSTAFLTEKSFSTSGTFLGSIFPNLFRKVSFFAGAFSCVALMDVSSGVSMLESNMLHKTCAHKWRTQINVIRKLLVTFVPGDPSLPQRNCLFVDRSMMWISETPVTMSSYEQELSARSCFCLWRLGSCHWSGLWFVFVFSKVSHKFPFSWPWKPKTCLQFCTHVKRH